jgi:hypothetical protein
MLWYGFVGRGVSEAFLSSERGIVESVGDGGDCEVKVKKRLKFR